jgi:uncharacterized membrane protein YgdD (TMEM256/DUF423 family)
MSSTILIVLAGLMGAGGVILAAAGAHGAPGAKLDSAAYMLLFHSAAVLGGAALLQQGQLWRPLGLIALTGQCLNHRRLGFRHGQQPHLVRSDTPIHSACAPSAPPRTAAMASWSVVKIRVSPIAAVR